MIYDLFKFLKEQHIEADIAKKIIPVLYQNPDQTFEQILQQAGYEKVSTDHIKSQIPDLKKQFEQIRVNHNEQSIIATNWIMGQLHPKAAGNIPLNLLKQEIEKHHS